MKITADQVAKVVPQRIFSLAVHPTESKILAFVGDKWGRLGLWDVVSISAKELIFLDINSTLFSQFSQNGREEIIHIYQVPAFHK